MSRFLSLTDILSYTLVNHPLGRNNFFFFFLIGTEGGRGEEERRSLHLQCACSITWVRTTYISIYMCTYTHTDKHKVYIGTHLCACPCPVPSNRCTLDIHNVVCTHVRTYIFKQLVLYLTLRLRSGATPLPAFCAISYKLRSAMLFSSAARRVQTPSSLTSTNIIYFRPGTAYFVSSTICLSEQFLSPSSIRRRLPTLCWRSCPLRSRIPVHLDRLGTVFS